MTGRRVSRRQLTALTGVLTCLAVQGLFGAPIAHAAPSQSGDPLTITVDSVSPPTPQRSNKNSSLTIELTLANTSSAAMRSLQIVAKRGYPLTTQSTVDAALRGTGAPTFDNPRVPIPPVTPVTVTVPAHGTVDTTFRTTTSLIDDRGLCICHEAVYPIKFSAQAADASASSQPLGSAVTYLPVFDHAVSPVHVSWVWSLLDRPHRLASDTVFEDDDLSSEVSSGGRLDRALSVVEQVDTDIPLTIVMDPEILDELQVMATTRYSVQDASGTVVGVGGAAAAAWLERLRQVLSSHPADSVELTALGDPDVQSVVDHGLTWSSTLPSAIATRVSQALGGAPTSADLAWPPSGRLDASALGSLAATGTTTVLIGAGGVRTSAGSTSDSHVATLSAGSTDVSAALTDSARDSDVDRAVTVPGDASAVLPRLMSELSVPVIAQPTAAHVIVLTSPRYVDPSVADAVSLIESVSDSVFTKPTALASVTASPYLPTSTSELRSSSASGGLTSTMFGTLASVTRAASTVRSMLDIPRATAQQKSAASAVLNSLPLALQRLKSSAWRTDGGDASLGENLADRLMHYVSSITSRVHIVRPATGVYTLGSSSSSLPITVTNPLNLPVRVIVDVSTVGSIPGFTAKAIGAQTIDARSTRTVQLPTKVQRSGRIQVMATLSAPNGTVLGNSVPLTVHSTALGRVGVIITVVAGVLLLLALIVRFVRAVARRRHHGTAKPSHEAVPAT